MNNPIDAATEALGHIGAIEEQVIEAPYAAYLAVKGGGLVRLAIQRQGQRGIDAERELGRVHVPIVWRDFDRENLYFYVKRSQARWADYALRRAGVEVTSEAVDPRNIEWAEGKGKVPAWDERGTGRVETAATSPSRERERRPLAGLVTRGERKRGGDEGSLLRRLKRWLWD